jgi:hypothetical protein
MDTRSVSQADDMVLHLVDATPANRRVGSAETIPRWGTTSRLALGLVTFAMPVIAAVIAMLSVSFGATPPPVLLAATFGFLITHCLLTFFYVAFAGQNPRVRSRMRWQLALIFAGPITIPAYWLIHVWNAPRRGYADVDGEVPGLDIGEANRLALAR